MIGAQIFNGNTLVAKVSETANPRDIVIAAINGKYCVKRVEKKGDSIILQSANPDFQDIHIKSTDDLRICGVVVYSIHSHR